MTKARMLQYLKNENNNFNILPIFVLICERGAKQIQHETVDDIISFSKGCTLAVRSSAKGEDNADFSNAGGFESVLNVTPDEKSICEAVERVYASYHTNDKEEILIQPMLQGIVKSGVVFTADMDTYADYDIINYSESSDSTAVTGGKSQNLRTFVHYKYSKVLTEDKDISALLENCREIEKILGKQALDIEFAVTKSHEVYILQVRPIAKGNKELSAHLDLSESLKRISRKVEKLSRRHPFLLGESTCFGVMPDWNPAEILGIRPRKLAVSLYKELVTDSVWAQQRYNYGYRDLTLHPLMVLFCGIPYIDTRVTFNSFVPKELDDKIAEKLVTYYVNKLKSYPKYHDKIEFEIVFSCYYFGLGDDLKTLLEYGFNENEIKRIEFSLLNLTNHVIDVRNGFYKKDIEQISILESNYNKIIGSNISLVDKIYWLIEECKKYGTLPFAGVARGAFIAVQFLKSLVKKEIISQLEYDRFMNSLNTVNKKLSMDLKRLHEGEISREDFLSQYGHIRPGTYDIMSKRYDEDFEHYFGDYKPDIQISEGFEFSKEVMERIQIEAEQNGLTCTAVELIEFIKETIEGREYLKFVFTKSVSKILSLIEELGVRADIEREDLSYLDINVVKQLYSDLYAGSVYSLFKENIKINKQQYEYAKRIKLPAIIIKPEEVYQYYMLDDEPNFITQKCIRAKVAVLDNDISDVDVTGKIVFIQSADPGYDFLFSKNIAGLVTQFGGANSHMAIRCAELGIPAVIGVGEKNFQEWKQYGRVTVDCLKKQVISD